MGNYRYIQLKHLKKEIKILILSILKNENIIYIPCCHTIVFNNSLFYFILDSKWI
jgi:hypothetical protein